MKLKDIIDQVEQIKNDWPDGFSFKNKSKFIGFSLNDKVLSIEDIESKEWGAKFESYDKEFNASMKSLFHSMNSKSNDK